MPRCGRGNSSGAADPGAEGGQPASCRLAAARDESERRVTFDPSYERVQFHDLRLIRDGVARDALGSADYRVLNREAGLEEALLDGRLSASSSSMTSAPATSSTSPGRCREIRPSSAVISTS